MSYKKVKIKLIFHMYVVQYISYIIEIQKHKTLIT